MVAEALVAGRLSRAQALVAGPLASTVRAFEPVPQAALLAGGAALPAAVIVFDRERHSNGRDEAFVQPAPAELLPLARQLRAGGARRLLVVVPHAPALSPQALAHGLANLDEAAVAALGFEHQVLLARMLPGLPPGSRVIAPETLWAWAQDESGLEAAVVRGLGPATPDAAAVPARSGKGAPP